MIRFARTLPVALLAATLAGGALSGGAISPVWAQGNATAPADGAKPKLQSVAFPPYSLLDRAFNKTVDKNGTVSYGAIKGNADLARYLEFAATADVNAFPTWPIPADPKVKDSKPGIDRSAELVFWINTYNAFVVKTISDAYPVDSPTDIKNFDTARTHTVAGKDYSFADLRGIIANLDPRGLFALTDGTVGGPLLNPIAYRYANLGFMLENAVKTFVNDDRNVSVMQINNVATVSDFFLTVNDAFANNTAVGGAERGKMTGIRYLLTTYTDKRAEKSFLTTGDYRIETKASDKALNLKKDN